MNFKALFFIFISLPFHFPSSAQPTQGGMRGGYPGMKPPAIGRIFGKIVDNRSKSIEYATVTLLALNKDSIITGALTKSNGDFLLNMNKGEK